MNTIVVKENIVDIISIGIQGPVGPAGQTGSTGPAGPIGPAGDGSLIYVTAGQILGGHRVVLLNSIGQAVYPNRSIPADADLVIGLTTTSAVQGGSVGVITAGEVIESSWAWIYGVPIWLGDNGLLTQIPPVTGWKQLIATVKSPTIIVMSIRQTILEQ